MLPSPARCAPAPRHPASRIVYLDANATEPVRPEAQAACLAAIDLGGNPSSVHRAGREARRLLEDSRESVARLVSSPPDRIVFTSGGTEANALAIHGLGASRIVVVGATEHPCVLAAAGPDAEPTPVLPDGTVDLDRLEAILARYAGRALLCLMAANNETGVMHPLDAALALCRRHGALLHVDAVQLPGRMAMPEAVLQADSIALSAHKQGGIPGAGALRLGPGIELASPLIAGGGQELGRRGGTPSLPAIAAYAAVANLPPPTHLARLRDRIESACRAAGATVFGADAPRLLNTLSVALPGRSAARQLIALDLAGFAVSAGAACSSGKISASPVLAAMAAGALAAEAIRISLPWNADPGDIDAFIAAYAAMSAGPPA